MDDFSVNGFDSKVMCTEQLKKTYSASYCGRLAYSRSVSAQ